MERDCPLSTAARMNAPRTLVCVLAETRSWKTTWPSFKMNVLDKLGADLALCIGAHETYDRSNPFWQSARYRWTSIEYGDYVTLTADGDSAEGVLDTLTELLTTDHDQDAGA